MPVPNFPDKRTHPATFTPAELIRANPAAAVREVPPSVIVCFQRHALRFLVDRHRGKKISGFLSEFYRLRRTDSPIGVVGSLGIGAPAAVFILEWLAALGVRNFLAIGFAGGLLERMNAGHLVVCERAVRDEGTSHHYLRDARYALPDEELKNAIARRLEDKGFPFETGGSWTTDAPFRETMAEVEHYASEGVLTVEMEAAAMFAVAESLGLRCAAAFSVGDSLKEGRWNLHFDRGAMNSGLEILAQAALESFEGMAAAP